MYRERVLSTYIVSASIYLAAQELLNILTYYWNIKLELRTFGFHYFYFVSPAISFLLILCSYLILKKIYRPTKEHYLLHILSWCFLFIPQICPPLLQGLNIIYVSWIFILSMTATGSVIFQDLALPRIDYESKENASFIYDEMKFYLDKLATAWLTLGTVLGICMTILWTAPNTAFNMIYEERVFWAVYMVFAFLTVTLLIFVHVGYPIYHVVERAKGVILDPNWTPVPEIETGNEPI